MRFNIIIEAPYSEGYQEATIHAQDALQALSVASQMIQTLHWQNRSAVKLVRIEEAS